MRRFLSILLTIVFCTMLFPCNVSASQFSVSSPELEEFSLVGTLTAPDGTQYLVPGSPVASAIPSSEGTTSLNNSLTYVFRVPAVNPGEGSLSGNWETDSKYTIEAYVSVYWDSKTFDYVPGYRLREVSTTWNYLDDNAIVKSATIHAQQFGVGLIDGSEDAVDEAKNIYNAKNGTRYATGFKNYLITYGLTTFQGANATYELAIGTSTWLFETGFVSSILS